MKNLFPILLTATFTIIISAPSVLAEGTDGADKIPTNMWVNVHNDSSWTFDKKDIVRSRNGRITHLRYKEELAEPFRLEYIVHVVDYRRGDGRGATLLSGRHEYKKGVFFTLGDDYTFGMVGSKKDGSGGWEYYAGSNEIKIEAGKQYHVIVDVLKDKMTMQVNGKTISSDFVWQFPYILELQVQRGGTLFKNIMLKKLKGEDRKQDAKRTNDQ